ncbi:hypothetical protein BDC45DRAFT_538525 [Circinella umbellata]|nr:hypothetical protein BDC45DRAFT_538525 [Circinella umbellata]
MSNIIVKFLSPQSIESILLPLPQQEGFTKKELIGVYTISSRWITRIFDFSITGWNLCDLVEIFEDTGQYVLLDGIRFTNSVFSFETYYPIIKKDGKCLKFIKYNDTK